MKKLLEITKTLFAVIGYVAGLITLLQFLFDNNGLKYKIFNAVQQFDFNYFGQLLQLIGIIIVLSGISIYIFLFLYNIYEPKRDLASIIAPLLLSKNDIGDPEEEYNKKFKLFGYIRIGASILIFGLITLLITHFYKF